MRSQQCSCTSTCSVGQRKGTVMPRMGYAGGGFFRDRGGQIGMVAITRRRFLALIKHIQVSGSEGGFGAATDAQFAVDTPSVLLHRLCGNTECFSDLAIGETRRDQPQNVMLASAQRFQQYPYARAWGCEFSPAGGQ